ncbi:phosphoribosylformylglycinamidine cyclo-ligase [Thermaerobacter marianensis DSM 12885]|uniref:Phosphoribosylformylglycinamidine cyclo-ligase n=1 Tax=Thermaerobacter marianensis (strain ATCC 700841 / DSM 12885 / JCM 10246 / 7p75a) TaxID=644966 RepID=E6SMP1_THEM7|nr:phosphoribosylformylglycinamidine cyclo-ligase [Thermaerobacter marianensis]ADU51533.1 phosphoribosylformylglycinamidine cyclo-ligase [Thermaerobacter marianensis DSM 12885]
MKGRDRGEGPGRGGAGGEGRAARRPDPPPPGERGADPMAGTNRPAGPCRAPASGRTPLADPASSGGPESSAGPAGARGLTYREAGVDLDAAEAVVDRIAGEAARARRPEVVGGLGAFAGFFRWGQGLLLAATCDGVGSKLAVALQFDALEAIGRDLVAMNVNDLLVHGAEPLFFLDYVAVERLDPERVARVVRGMADACREAGCALLGGETAEVPGLLPPGGMELAGFAVGSVAADRLVDGRRVEPGDAVLGLPSSGPHSNGFSLIRRVVAAAGARWHDPLPGTSRTLAEAALVPTRLYTAVVRRLRAEFDVRAMAHITGGGLPGNLPRTLPPGCRAVLQWGRWPVPPLFRWIQRRGPVAWDEMARVFNLGIGFAVVVPAGQARAAARAASEVLGEEVPVIGRVTAGPRGVEFDPPLGFDALRGAGPLPGG